MKIKISILICIMALVFACEKTVRWPWKSQNITVFSGPIEIQTPSVIQTQDGEWLAVFSSQTENSDVEGLILMIRSKQLQGPWSEPDTIAQTANLCQNPQMTQLKNGMIWVQFELGNITENNAWNRLGTAYTRSYDYGQRFSVPRMIYVPEVQSWHGVHAIIETFGLWLLPMLYENPDSYDKPGLIFSHDEGETWSKVISILPEDSKLKIINFSMEKVNDQKLLILMELNYKDLLIQSYSRNRGMNWTEPKFTNIYGSQPAILQSLTGTVYCLYQDDYPEGASLMRSFDFGRTFEQETNIKLPSQSSFPCMLELETNQMVFFYTTNQGIFAKTQSMDQFTRPTGFSASADSFGVTLRWNPVKQASYYRIYRCLGADSLRDDMRFYDITTESSYQDSLIKSNTTYSYQITAVQGIGKLFSESGSESQPSHRTEATVP
ncbi:exo-alpha-sialidase [bacterium]